ncbi:FAD-dependent oxidoreductase [Sporosarcina newyorkensis]|uniref:3-(3-hydroxy-phenyl)propionate hydroxylase n=1 Tax=Sporosarcina newyorkensis TaxID=759851 RepID=A0A1T4Y8A8_9BACL|nr:NAD(P)/FAD-dependent oxidoreductase [Sporosarcina newyorkensis]SKA98057.1 3-(3-hydroxy-phenyl)propionate hydroxylase [Sporosarcina newyorkensis]
MDKNVEVVVVGSGPVGLTAALALQNKGISCVVIEAEEKDAPRAGSRAIYLHNATLKLLEEASKGLGFTLAKNGVIWPIKRTLYRGKEVYVRNYGVTDTQDPNRLPHFTSLHQHAIEKHIYEACLKSGVQFIYGQPVTELEIAAEGVQVTTKNGDVWKAKYVIGCDGGRSVVRQEAGLTFEGPRTHDTFLVVDVTEDEENPLPIERVFHYQHPAMGRRNVMHVPFKGGWRVDLQLLADDKEEDFSSIEGVKEWLPKVMDQKYVDRITWVSSYRFHQVVVDSFTDEKRRVLLAGEAAHLFAPFGARGLNSGVPDAIIAVRGIQHALQADNEEQRQEAIDVAAKERRIAALWNRDGSTTALHHIQGDSPEMNMKRELASSLVSIVPRLGRWLDEGPYGPKFGPPELTTKY